MRANLSHARIITAPNAITSADAKSADVVAHAKATPANVLVNAYGARSWFCGPFLVPVVGPDADPSNATRTFRSPQPHPTMSHAY